MSLPVAGISPQPSDVAAAPPVIAPDQSRRTPASTPAIRPLAASVRPAPVRAPDRAADDVPRPAPPPVPSLAAASLPAPAATTPAGDSRPGADAAPAVAGASAPSSAAQTPPSTATNAPAPAAVRASGRELDTLAIEGVLERYREAFNRLDARAASAIWPSVNTRTLTSAFERLKYQNVFFSSCQIVLGGVFAEATCIGSTRYEPNVGSRATKPEARRWRFDLRKSGTAWLIDRVDMR